MKSIKLSPVEGRQIEIPLGKPKQEPIELSVITRQPDQMAAVRLCIQVSGLDEKNVCMTLGIDAGHWTRIMKGDAHFPLNKLNALMDLCANDIPLIWQAHSRGFELKPLKSTIEQRMEALRQENDALKSELETLAKYGVIQRPKA